MSREEKLAREWYEKWKHQGVAHRLSHEEYAIAAFQAGYRAAQQAAQAELLPSEGKNDKISPPPKASVTVLGGPQSA